MYPTDMHVPVSLESANSSYNPARTDREANFVTRCSELDALRVGYDKVIITMLGKLIITS